MRGDEKTVADLPADLRLTDGVAEAVLRMRVTVRVNVGAFDEIGFAVDPDGQVATLSLQAQVALPAGSLHDAGGPDLTGSCLRFFFLGKSGYCAEEEQHHGNKLLHIDSIGWLNIRIPGDKLQAICFTVWLPVVRS